jgi:hypothetical protein
MLIESSIKGGESENKGELKSEKENLLIAKLYVIT